MCEILPPCCSSTSQGCFSLSTRKALSLLTMAPNGSCVHWYRRARSVLETAAPTVSWLPPACSRLPKPAAFKASMCSPTFPRLSPAIGGVRPPLPSYPGSRYLNCYTKSPNNSLLFLGRFGALRILSRINGSFSASLLKCSLGLSLAVSGKLKPYITSGCLTPVIPAGRNPFRQIGSRI